jgi:hypothetical protein
VKFTFHRFNVGDVEDPEIIAGWPIAEWQKTEKGQWVMRNAHDLTYHSQIDKNYWGYDFVIRGTITDPKKVTEYLLRWGK